MSAWQFVPYILGLSGGNEVVANLPPICHQFATKTATSLGSGTQHCQLRALCWGNNLDVQANCQVELCAPFSADVSSAPFSERTNDGTRAGAFAVGTRGATKSPWDPAICMCRVDKKNGTEVPFSLSIFRLAGRH